jgi:hypothetical protein
MPRLTGNRQTTALLLLAVTLLGSACSPDGVQESRGPAVDAAAVSVPQPPAPGTARIELAGGRISLWSNGAPLLGVVKHLAEQAGFELFVAGIEDTTLTLRIEDAELGDALGELLTGIPYSLEYEPDPESGSQRLIRLVMGYPVSIAPLPPVAELSAKPEDPIADSLEPAVQESMRRHFERVRERVMMMTPEEMQLLREEHLARAEAAEPELLEQLEDLDPGVRLDAVENLPIEGEGAIGEERLHRMTSIAEEDPDRSVRIAALDRLGEVNHPESLRVLLDTLSDPDPGLVLKAIEALEFANDSSAIPSLEPLLEHSNSEIREAAESAIDWLEEE